MSVIEAAGTRLPIYQGVTLPPLAGGLRGVRRQHFTSCFALSFDMSQSFYVREAILRYLEDMEDTFIAIERLETPSKRWTLVELENE